ncbi:hypothetical protein COCCADRAFT_40829 [Bipolaris zeicola 26-R-13]|uniref:Uncharacterized protein n=1 Tax=Cochliobolus carbonum (strain 26-R-13) TaxID=930089 RepID=W6XSQ8_COCC2|nr:uncharacterized protein COCCADRAFT_40829 [Bipolaris zeicola 26-R-13]EUC28678.1 hypothetical protein COCCADRAFT_40829 [Bipolaris zeicola 26-R-13]
MARDVGIESQLVDKSAVYRSLIRIRGRGKFELCCPVPQTRPLQSNSFPFTDERTATSSRSQPYHVHADSGTNLSRLVEQYHLRYKPSKNVPRTTSWTFN